MRVLIVDDEPIARRGLRREIERVPGVVCVGECGTRDEAVSAIVREQPDVVLLDVQLGGSSGFDVIESIGLELMPLVIFVTAYDRHALRAFEVHAADYVLKPVDPERLHEALAHAQRIAGLDATDTRVERLAALQRATSTQPNRPADRLVVPDGGRLAFVDVSAIDWIEAFGNHVRIHAGARAYVLRSTLTRMEQRVGNRQFLRVRRSALVNAAAIVTLESYGRGMFSINLRSGASVISSRYHGQALRQYLGRT